MSNRPIISVIVPAYNEARRLPDSIAQIVRFLDEKSLQIEVILVVEKSVDETAAIATEIAKRDPRFRIILNDQHHGKGRAVKTGMMAALGDFVFFMDADLATSLQEIPRFVRTFQQCQGIDVLIGSRNADDLQARRRHGLFRGLSSRLLKILLMELGFLEMMDTQCGFKAFRKRVVKQIFSLQTIDGFAFDIEILLIAQHLNVPLISLPVKWTDQPFSKVRVIRDSIRMLRDIISIRRNHSLRLEAYGPRDT
jgi:dolichyl-phosphate beta-glucosyltransferase